MNPFGPFLWLMRCVGWPPPNVFLEGLAPVLVWHVLGAFAPEVSDQVRLSWAVLLYFTALTWSRCRTGLEQAKRNDLNQGQVAKIMFGSWVVTSVFIVLTQELAWAQHWITWMFTFAAFAYSCDCVFKVNVMGRWSDVEMQKKVGPSLYAAFALLFAALALLNETLIVQLSFQAWVIWLSVVSLARWLLTRMLTLTILISTEREDD